MQKSFFLMVVGVVAVGFLNMGVIRKKDDHVAFAQTDPILYEKKMEELKDGEKGPSMPVMTLYAKSDFLTKSPVRDEAGQAPSAPEGEEAPLEEGLPEDLGPAAEEGAGDEYWWVEEDGKEQKEQEEVKESPPLDDQQN
ncbi:MAG: hypothetical protein WCU74_02400 [Candidatus Omnitrophota bacterium]